MLRNLSLSVSKNKDVGFFPPHYLLLPSPPGTSGWNFPGATWKGMSKKLLVRAGNLGSQVFPLRTWSKEFLSSYSQYLLVVGFQWCQNLVQPHWKLCEVSIGLACNSPCDVFEPKPWRSVHINYTLSSCFVVRTDVFQETMGCVFNVPCTSRSLL